MKKYLMIAGVLVAFLLFSAKSCTEDPEVNRLREEEKLTQVMDSVKEGFEAGYLDEASLFAFTCKAKQKLADYSGYMNIANDISLDSAFRTQALAMAKELFSMELPTGRPSPGEVIQVDSIWVAEPLRLSREGIYTGELGFRETSRRKSVQDTSGTIQSFRKAGIQALKSKKVFGSDTMKVWQVYLGEIY